MGSLSGTDTSASTNDYPDASDPSLVLTHPTEAEKRQTWRLNHGEWGGPLSLEDYLEREPFLGSTPLASDGGLTHWILTEPPSQNSPSTPDQKRKVLASCETLRKVVLYVPAGGSEVKEGYGYGIGSVYTYPEFRQRGYAPRMLKDLAMVLRTWPAEQKGVQEANSFLEQQENQVPLKSFCSTLWSDIGKKYYASKGWPTFDSEHVEFRTLQSDFDENWDSEFTLVFTHPGIMEISVSPVNSNNLATLCRKDEAQLRRQMIKHARETGRAAFAYAPRPDVFRWHWARQDFQSARLFPNYTKGPPSGIAVTVTSRPSSPSASASNGTQNGHHPRANGDNKETEGQLKKVRMWAIWSRNYAQDAANQPEKNVLTILRLVIDDGESDPTSRSASTPGDPDPIALQVAFNEIIRAALGQARRWNCGTVRLWSPGETLRRVILGSGLEHKFVDREDSVPSLMWYGSEDESQIDWMANEKYCWC